MRLQIVEERAWWPTLDDLLGDLEVHYPGCCGADCLCDRVDLSVRLAPEVQLEAMYVLESMWREWEDGGPDPACLWPEYW